MLKNSGLFKGIGGGAMAGPPKNRGGPPARGGGMRAGPLSRGPPRPQTFGV